MSSGATLPPLGFGGSFPDRTQVAFSIFRPPRDSDNSKTAKGKVSPNRLYFGEIPLENGDKVAK